MQKSTMARRVPSISQYKEEHGSCQTMKDTKEIDRMAKLIQESSGYEPGGFPTPPCCN